VDNGFEQGMDIPIYYDQCCKSLTWRNSWRSHSNYD
jgi:hypothetical protein